MEINPLKKWDIPHKYAKLKEKFAKRIKSSNFETTYVKNFLYEMKQKYLKREEKFIACFKYLILDLMTSKNNFLFDFSIVLRMH